METITEFIGFCRQGLHGTGLQAAGLPLALFLAGLAGSLVHCVGMCGPFVLGQVVADSERTTGGYGEWQRLAGAALLPYHLNRLTTYTALGLVAGGATALFAATTGFAWLSALLLALAAVLLTVPPAAFCSTITEERTMSHWIMGVFTAVLGLAGLFMAGAARDFGILAFGLALTAYATLFCWWMIKTAFEEAEKTPASAPSPQE